MTRSASLLALLALAPPALAQAETLFLLRTWPDHLLEYDPAEDRVLRSMQNKFGICHGTEISHDRTELFQITNRRTTIEVVDLATLTVKEHFNFEEPDRIVRVENLIECPGGKRWYVEIERVKKALDHYEVEEPEWLLFDREQGEVIKRAEKLPKAIRRGARISPDGTKWHVFGKDLEVVTPETFEVEGKIELSKPLYSGMGAIALRGEDFYDGRNPSAYRMLYTMRDPLRKNRSIAGVVDLDLRELAVTSHVEWGAAPRVWTWHMDRARKVAVGQSGAGEERDQEDGEDPILTLIRWDLEKGVKLLETRVEVRNGLSLAGISPDGTKSYLTGRGHELVVYDDQNRYLKTVEFEGELDGRMIVLQR